MSKLARSCRRRVNSQEPAWPPDRGSGATAFLFESNDRLAAGDGDFAVDDCAFRDGNCARDNVGVNDRGRTDFQFVFDDQLSGDAPGDDRGQRVDLAFPLRLRGHAEGTPDATVATYATAYDQRTSSFDIAGEMAPFGYKGRRAAELINQSSLRQFAHHHSSQYGRGFRSGGLISRSRKGKVLTMITIRARSGAIGVCLLLLVAGCSREQQDWRSAEAADTIEGYGQFIQRHPESELATQARTRVAQLGEDRDWQHAGSADTVDAYRDFIAQHPNGKWAEEARIRIQNFSLGEQAGSGSRAADGTGAGTASGGGAGRGPAGPSAGVATGAGAGTASGGGAGRGPAGSTAGVATGAGAETALVGGAGRVATGTGSEARADAAGGQSRSSAPSGARSYGLASPGEAAASPTGSPVPRSTATSGHSAPAASVGAGDARGAGSGSADTGSGRAGGNGMASPGEAAMAPPTSAGAHRSAGVAGSQGQSSTAGSGASATSSGTSKAVAGGFGIQLGAFSTEAGANNEWRLLASRYAADLQGLQEHVVPANTASGRIYRLQVPVGDEGRARAICDSLRKHGQGCVAVLPH